MGKKGREQSLLPALRFSAYWGISLSTSTR